MVRVIPKPSRLPERQHTTCQEVPQATPRQQTALGPGELATQPAREIFPTADRKFDRYIQGHGQLVRQQCGPRIARLAQELRVAGGPRRRDVADVLPRADAAVM